MKPVISLPLLLVLISAIFACSDRKEANEDNYGHAVQKYLDRKFPLKCLTYHFPVSTRESSREHDILMNLKRFGIVKIKEIREQDGRATSWSTEIIRVNQYFFDLTYRGSSHYYVDEECYDNDKRNFLGFGKANLTRIDKAVPYEANGRKLVNVHCTFEVSDVPEWARDKYVLDAIRLVHPKICRDMEKYGRGGLIKELLTLELGEKEWEVLEKKS